MDETAQVAVCYLSTCKMPLSISEYRKNQKLSQMQTLLASLGITMMDMYVDEDFEPMSADKPELKRVIDRLMKKEFGVFVTGSIYDLGDDFLDCIKMIQSLVEHHIRVICLNNYIDSAIIGA